MIRFIFLLVFIFCAAPAHARDMDDFKAIPILHEGRVKPIDTFARAELKKIYGRQATRDQDAASWLAEVLFDPATAVNRPVFRIESVNLRHSLGLRERKDLSYSFAELVPGLKRTSPAVTALLKRGKALLTQDNKDLMRVHDDALAYTALLRSLSLLLPLDVALPEKYKSRDRAALSYLDLKKFEQALSKDVRALTSKKGENLSAYSADERATALLSFQLNLMSAAAAGNDVLKIIPPQWSEEDWHAPWELLQSGEGSPQTAKLLGTWRDMGLAYINGNESQWDKTTKDASSPGWKIKAEVIQNTFPPVDISTGLYVVSFLAALLFIVFGKMPLYAASFLSLGAGAAAQLSGIVLRVILLDRPPVGTLYESLIFVSLIIVVLSFTIEKIARNGTGLLAGGFSGAVIGLLSYGFAGDGDTMEMLTAVLNTNFWLATHVLCITIGYGWCILTALFAHLCLINRAWPIREADEEKSLFILHMLGVFSLLFTAIGTILGGIWADQSWGRFWGWDPKENGALLIVLWLVWLLHGKLGGQLGQTGFLAALAYLNVIVAISWIGVNLLGVGLHSYGFADGFYYGLVLFILFETALIAFLAHRTKRLAA